MTGTAAMILLLKATVLLGAAGLATHLLRRAAATYRYAIWTAAFAALVVLPLLASLLPALRVPVPVWSMARESAPAAIPSIVVTRRYESVPMVASGAPADPIAPSPAAASIRRPSLLAMIVGVWLVGVVAALIALVVSLVRVRRLADSSVEIDDADWREACARVSARLGVMRRVRIFASRSVATPMAGGILRPAVFVPLDAMAWSGERREIVLAHEINHLANGDPLRHLVSRVAFALYWFHPLVWLAVSRATADCEQACDEAVLALGIRPSTYARVLLEFADAAPLPTLSAALPMLRPARLESRLMFILSSSPRSSMRYRAILPICGAVALTLSVAAMRPVAHAPSVERLAATPAPAIEPPPSIPAAVTALKRTPDAAVTANPVATVGSLIAGRSALIALPTTGQSGGGDCWLNDFRSLSGRVSSSDSGVSSARVIQESFGDLRVCATTSEYRNGDADRPSDWLTHAPHLVLETSRPNDVRQMVIDGGRVTWTINGRSLPVDAAANTWRDDLLAVLDATWDVSQLRGQVSTLRGEISTIRGEQSTLQGEISTLRGNVSTMRGQISTVRGEESTLRGEIATIQGQVSTLRGQISTEQGAISSLRASPNGYDVDAQIRRHEDAIRNIEDEIQRFDAPSRIQAVQRRIDALDVTAKVSAIEQQIRDFDLDGKIAAVNRRIDDLDVEPRIDAIERDITALDADNRAPALEARRDGLVARLRTTLAR
jgi:beta-lactamase regulating signal transducer with metallopeptidase domain